MRAIMGCTVICSADWQLGMRRRFLGPDAQVRYSQARLEVIEAIAALAAERSADAVVVGGDVFDANQVDRHVVLRAAEMLAAVPCQVLLLPGNHDSLEPGTVWQSAQWRGAVPPNVTVLADEPVLVGTGADRFEVVGAPWRSRRPVTDPLTGLLSALAAQPVPALPRVVVGHTQVDTLAPGLEHPPVSEAQLEAVVASGHAQFVVLGDRHSTTVVGSSGRVWFPGTPEVTDFDELDPGNVVVARLDRDGGCATERVRVGRWHMIEVTAQLDGGATLDQLENRLAALPDKTRTCVRLGLTGSLDVVSATRLELLLDALGEVFACIQRWRKQWDLRPAPDDDPLEGLALAGPAHDTLVDLREAARSGNDVAAQALVLLHRLVLGAA